MFKVESEQEIADVVENLIQGPIDYIVDKHYNILLTPKPMNYQ